MDGVAAVMGLALVECFVLSGLVGRARVKYKIAAPATTGDPIFERYFRVHQNTLESLVIFIPGLWLFATYLNTPIAIALGLIFVAARVIYAAGYIKAPEKREVGAGLTFLVNAALVLGGLAGLARHAM
jgi:uncharacterized membrane protein YecN with MAPEG domain